MESKVKTKTVFITISIIIILLVCSAVGTTFAIWEGASGENTFSSEIESINWNSWEKYFDYEIVNAEVTPNTIAIVGFSKSFNMRDIVFPYSIDGRTVVEIKSTLFSDSHIKNMPVSFTIPTSITKISSFAFMNLPNLEKITFGVVETMTNSITVGNFAFVGCTSLREVVINPTATAIYGTDVFAGCTNLTV